MEEARLIGLDWVRSLGMLPNEYLFYYYRNREAVAQIRDEAQTRGQFLSRPSRGTSIKPPTPGRGRLRPSGIARIANAKKRIWPRPARLLAPGNAKRKI